MRLLLALTFALTLAGFPAQAQFHGRFVLIDNPGGADGKLKKLKYDFGYTDPRGIGWEAPGGLATDGASIPAWAQPIIGGAYDASFIKAAVLHDHYCEREVRPWDATHRMFYNALRAQGVSRAKSLVMYYAVLIGAHKWIRVLPGSPCNITGVCVRSAAPEAALLAATSQDSSTPGAQVIMTRAPIYQDIPALTARLRKIERDIRRGRLSATPAAMLKRARQDRPTDYYLMRPAVITATDM